MGHPHRLTRTPAIYAADGKTKLDRVLDSAATPVTGQPTAPDYVGTVVNTPGNGITALNALDSPGVAIELIPSNRVFIRDLQSVAVRSNFRMYLVWRFPDRNGGTPSLFTLGYIDWTVYFRAEPDPTGKLAPTAASKVVANKFVPDHADPLVLTAPDFNLNYSK